MIGWNPSTDWEDGNFRWCSVECTWLIVGGGLGIEFRQGVLAIMEYPWARYSSQPPQVNSAFHPFGLDESKLWRERYLCQATGKTVIPCDMRVRVVPRRLWTNAHQCDGTLNTFSNEDPRGLSEHIQVDWNWGNCWFAGWAQWYDERLFPRICAYFSRIIIGRCSILLSGYDNSFLLFLLLETRYCVFFQRFFFSKFFNKV